MVDDVIDRSDVRSGWSAYKVFGEGVSLLAAVLLKSSGSSLLAAALEKQTHFVNRLRAAREFEAMYLHVYTGQLLDILYEASPIISERQYLRMIQLSTGGFLEDAAAIGSTLSGAPDHVRTPLLDCARYTGVALQIYDDVLDLIPQPSRTKPFASDIKRRKKRLPLIHFLHNCPASEKREVDRIFRKRTITEMDSKLIVELLRHRGSIQYAVRRAEKLYSRALFNASKITPPYLRELLVELVGFIRPEEDPK